MFDSIITFEYPTMYIIYGENDDLKIRTIFYFYKDDLTQ